jgi:hypothetical protein
MQSVAIKAMFSKAEMLELPRRALLAMLNENLPLVDPSDSKKVRLARIATIQDRVNLARYRAGLKRWEQPR